MLRRCRRLPHAAPLREPATPAPSDEASRVERVLRHARRYAAVALIHYSALLYTLLSAAVLPRITPRVLIFMIIQVDRAR